MSKRTQIANPNDPRNAGKTNPNDMFNDENEAESNIVSKVFIGKVFQYVVYVLGWKKSKLTCSQGAYHVALHILYPSRSS
jgi:hypothetical protein